MSVSALTQPLPDTVPFDERIGTLSRHLTRAARLNKPALLLAVYRSECVRADAERHLTERLRESGQTVTQYRVTGDETADIPTHLVNHPERSHTVFFVSGLRWGGGLDGRNAFRALNLRREYFVDACLRVVFWLTEFEESSMLWYARDFWFFRSRVVSFLEPPALAQVQYAVRQFLQHDANADETKRSQKTRYNNIKRDFWERLLPDVGRFDETLPLYGKVLSTLARLRQSQGDYQSALALLQEALFVAEETGDTALQRTSFLALGTLFIATSRYDEALLVLNRALDLASAPDATETEKVDTLLALGTAYRLAGLPDTAINRFQEARQIVPTDARIPLNLGATYHMMAHYDDAIAAFQQALELNPHATEPYIRLGQLYREQGHYPEALAVYQDADVHNADSPRIPKELGDVYLLLGRADDAAEAYERAAYLQQQMAVVATEEPQDDLYTPYETGLRTLLRLLDGNEPAYDAIVSSGQRLLKNIEVSRRYGDTQDQRYYRSEIIHQLNQRALETIGQSFNDMCPFPLYALCGFETPVSALVVFDRYTHYEAGLTHLISFLERDHPVYNEAWVYRMRLEETIDKVRLFGDSSYFQRERATVVALLNEYTSTNLEQSFFALCQQGEAVDPATYNTDSVLLPQVLRLQEKRAMLVQAFEQESETIRHLEGASRVETDPVRSSRLARSLTEAERRRVNVLLELELVEESLQALHASRTNAL